MRVQAIILEREKHVGWTGELLPGRDKHAASPSFIAMGGYGFYVWASYVASRRGRVVIEIVAVRARLRNERGIGSERPARHAADDTHEAASPAGSAGSSAASPRSRRRGRAGA